MLSRQVRVVATRVSSLSRSIIRRRTSYAYGSSKQKLRCDTIAEAFEDVVAKNKDKLAVVSVHQDIERTYGQLATDCHKLAAALVSLGVQKGDRVGIWSPNCYEWILTQFATAQLGAVLVNVNPAYQDKELAYCLNLVGCHTLIAAQKHRKVRYADILERAAPGLFQELSSGTSVHSEAVPSLKNLVFIDNDEDIAPAPVTRLHDLLAAHTTSTALDANLPRPHFDEIINVQFTSGTTGQPKGAALSHFNYVNNAAFSADRILSGLSKKVICVPNPLYHTFGSIVGSLLAIITGSTLVLPSPSPVPAETIKAISDYECTIVYGTPTMFADMLNSPDVDKFELKSLERAVMSGSPCPAELIVKLQAKFENLKSVAIPYGATETSPVITVTEPGTEPSVAMTSVGTPIAHIEVKLIDGDGALVPRGSPGEVLTRGHNVFIGYWGQAEKTAEAVDAARWYHTGDIGVMDEADRLSIVGRIKDLVIRGGENIYPREVEDVLQGHPDVADVNVVGVPDERLGEELCACIVLRPGAQELTRENLATFMKDKITYFKIPRYVLIVEDFPRTVTMKVQKKDLREIAMEKLELG